MEPLAHHVLLHLDDRRRRPVLASEIFFVEAVEDRTRVRFARARAIHDVRSLGEVMPALEAHGFLRIHRNHAVNLRRVLEIRRRDVGRDWEVKLEPPVNRVLPVSRDTLHELWQAFGSR